MQMVFLRITLTLAFLCLLVLQTSSQKGEVLMKISQNIARMQNLKKLANDQQIKFFLVTNGKCQDCSIAKIAFFGLQKKLTKLKNIQFLKKDCSMEEDFCKNQQITQFPSLIIKNASGKTIERMDNLKSTEIMNMISLGMETIRNQNIVEDGKEVIDSAKQAYLITQKIKQSLICMLIGVIGFLLIRGLLCSKNKQQIISNSTNTDMYDNIEQIINQ